MQYIMETIIIDLVKAKRPPHPMKRAIGWWNDALEDWDDADWLTDRDRYFSSFYFLSIYLGNIKLKKVKEFIKENDKMIKCYRENGLSNEEAVKLRHKWYLDKIRMLAKLKELNIKLWECQMGSPIWHQEMHGNLRKIYYKEKEIIY